MSGKEIIILKSFKVPAGSIIYAKGRYNTISPTNPNPVMVQSGFNTEDEMFVFIFQFLPYQSGDENISIETSSITTNINSTLGNSSNSKLLKIIDDFTGKEVRFKKNLPLFIHL